MTENKKTGKRKILLLSILLFLCILAIPANATLEFPDRDAYQSGFDPYATHFFSATESFNPASGTFIISHNDVFLPGRNGLDVILTRTYNSGVWVNNAGGDNVNDDMVGQLKEFSNLGVGWEDFRFGFLKFTEMTSPNYKFFTHNSYVELADGSQHYIYRTGDNTHPFRIEGKPEWELTKVSGDFILKLKDGTQYFFDSSTKYCYDYYGFVSELHICGYWVTKITDSNGNFISINYKEIPQEQGQTHGDPGNENIIVPKNHGVIESITDSLGREVYFNYNVIVDDPYAIILNRNQMDVYYVEHYILDNIIYFNSNDEAVVIDYTVTQVDDRANKDPFPYAATNPIYGADGLGYIYPWVHTYILERVDTRDSNGNLLKPSTQYYYNKYGELREVVYNIDSSRKSRVVYEYDKIKHDYHFSQGPSNNVGRSSRLESKTVYDDLGNSATWRYYYGNGYDEYADSSSGITQRSFLHCRDYVWPNEECGRNTLENPYPVNSYKQVKIVDPEGNCIVNYYFGTDQHYNGHDFATIEDLAGVITATKYYDLDNNLLKTIEYIRDYTLEYHYGGANNYPCSVLHYQRPIGELVTKYGSGSSKAYCTLYSDYDNYGNIGKITDLGEVVSCDNDIGTDTKITEITYKHNEDPVFESANILDRITSTTIKDKDGDIKSKVVNTYDNGQEGKCLSKQCDWVSDGKYSTGWAMETSCNERRQEAISICKSRFPEPVCPNHPSCGTGGAYVNDIEGGACSSAWKCSESFTGCKHYSDCPPQELCVLWYIYKDFKCKSTESYYYYDYIPCKGNLLTTTQIDFDGDPDLITSYDYDDYGNVITVTGPENHKIETRYDGPTGWNAYPTYGWNQEYGDQTNSAWGKTYYKNGLLKSETDANGDTTYYYYDKLDRLVKVARPGDSESSPTTEYKYDDWNKIITVRQKRSDGVYNNKIYYFYNGLAKLIQTRQRNVDNTKTIVCSVKYNDIGQRHYVSKPYEDIPPADNYVAPDWNSLISEHKVTINNYDGLGRIKEVINLDDSRIQTTYGANWVQREDEEGKVTTSHYDAFGNLVKMTEANNQDTFYSYNILDNLLTITDPEGRMTTNTYDTFSRLESTTHPDTGLTAFTHDKNGNIKTKTDAKNQIINYDYDALNRLTKIDYPASSDVNYFYDNDCGDADAKNTWGGLRRVEDASGTTDYEYDDRWRLKKEIKTINGTTYTTTYDYDSADNMIRLVDPIDRATTYDYNKLNQIQSVNIKNLLQNPRFEHDLINWEIQGDPQPDIVETVLNPKKFGDKAVHIKIDKRSIWSGIRSVEVPLQPNTIYTISAWIYVPNDFTAWCEWGEWGDYYCTDQDYTTPPRQRRCSIVGEDCNDFSKIVYDCFDAGDTYCKYNPNGPWYCRARPCVKKSSGNLISGYWELHRHAYNADRSNPHSYTIIGGDYTWDNNVPREQWIRKYITIKTEPDVVSGRVFVITQGEPGSTGEVYVDGIQVEAGDTATLFSSVSYNYTPSGTINLINFPNSVETSYTYTPRDWAEKIDTNYFYHESPMPIFSRYYEYDNVGNLENLYTSPGNLIAQFNYDNLDRLTGVTDYDYFGKNIEYTYDRSGNRQKITFTFPGPFSSLLRYHYDSGTNKLTKITDISGGLPLAYFHYDANGNLIDKSGRNLLGNPSFESGVGTDAFLWSVVGVDPTKNVRSSDKSHSGRYSIKSTFTSPGGPDVATITTDFIPVKPNTQYVATITTDFIPVEPNTQYTVSGWVYNSLSSGNAYVSSSNYRVTQKMQL